MKKFLIMLCMLTCLFGLTACGNENALSSSDQANAERAKAITTNLLLPYLCQFADDEMAQQVLAEYDKKEMEYIAETDLYYMISLYGLSQSLGMNTVDVDGSAVLSGITSFNSAFDSIGELKEAGEAKAEVSADEIIVTVPITGSLQKAEAEFIFSNDIFLTVQAAALNPDASLGDKMGKAGLNTLMGMGTVFVVLILISLIISAMGLIPKLQNKMKKKADKADEKENKPAAIAETVTAAVEEEELSDDLELIAVIAAAIAASEDAASADGFVVRSIRKARR